MNLSEKDGHTKHIFVCTHILSYKLGYPNLKPKNKFNGSESIINQTICDPC